MTAIHLLAPIYMVLCILLGGASAAGFLSNAVLQLAALPILYWAFMAHRRTAPSAPARQLMGLVILLLALFVVQLVPMPPSLWMSLPGRPDVAAGFEQLGLALPWLSVSLNPQATIASLLWLIPAFALLFAIVRIGAFRTTWLAWALVGATMLSIGVGATQVAGGESATTYFYQITNRGFAVGFFSNNNHMATLLLACIPFLAALKVASSREGRRARKSASGATVLIGAAALLIIVGLAINTSLAGIGLAVPTIAASLLLIRSKRKAVPVWAFPAVAVLAVAALAAVLIAPIGNNLVGNDAKGSAESRAVSFARTFDAATEFFPAGSGIGTFQSVYRTQEPPSEVTATYMNHAHSDVLEVLLETGVLGVLLFCLFLIWWGKRTFAIWLAGDADIFARAATIASAAIMAHSFVDYPLRTAAISALFAACLALMVEPRPFRARRDDEEPSARHLSAD